MGMFEDVFEKAKNVADMAGKKTGELVEISKLRINAADVQTKIDKEFQELGTLVYTASKEHSDCTESVHERAVAIDALFAELAELNEKISELRRMKKCPECQYANPEDANFCLNCGAKL